MDEAEKSARRARALIVGSLAALMGVAALGGLMVDPYGEVVAVGLALWVLPLITAFKARWSMLVVGALMSSLFGLGLLVWIGAAVSIARPRSLWARAFYAEDPERMERARDLESSLMGRASSA